MLVVYVIGQRHLVCVDSFLDAEFRNNDIECAVEHSHYSSSTDDRAESLSQVMNEVA